MSPRTTVRVLTRAVIALALALGAGAAATGGAAAAVPAGDPASSGASAPAAMVRDLMAAYAATARYHRLDAAIADGWSTDATGCLDFPDGYLNDGPGAMGHHYLHAGHYLDGGVLDAAEPEVLMYETRPDGSKRLLGVEYIVPEADLPRDAEPPVLFGRELQYHEMFDAWALHVWLWRPNPYGLFADVNPRVSCDHAS